jgi:hypothetical protein
MTVTYLEVLHSERWQQLKWRRIMRAEFACERCGRRYHGRRVKTAMRYFQLHHRHYRTVGRESLADVAVLCRLCHRLEHGLVSE